MDGGDRMSMRRMALLWLLVALLVACGAPASRPAEPPPGVTPTESQEDVWRERREQMVETQIRQRGVEDEAVLRVMERVPRHLFVPADSVGRAYGDHPLPIGYGQTISQPYIVAVMTELLAVSPGDRVLEIGTGSAYQAAVLAELTDEVYTIEIVPELCAQATDRLRTLGYDAVEVRCGDGYYGWEEAAPFDGIMVTAAPDHIPQPLVSQLADGGRMVIPVGPPGAYQVLWLLQRDGEQVISERVMGVAFVPLTGEH
jgi:protein-L-isoaspartate(D-aspartate) O-methyltransferase